MISIKQNLQTEESGFLDLPTIIRLSQVIRNAGLLSGSRSALKVVLLTDADNVVTTWVSQFTSSQNELTLLTRCDR